MLKHVPKKKQQDIIMSVWTFKIPPDMLEKEANDAIEKLYLLYCKKRINN